MRLIGDIVKYSYLRMKTDFIHRCKMLIGSFDGGYSSLKTPIRKNYFLLKMLLKHPSQSILELGSGTTTLMFDWYIRRYGGQLYAYEHQKQWYEAVKILLNGKNTSYRYVSMRDLDDSTEYVTEFDNQYDFLYIDGPPTKGKYNSDFLQVIDQPTLKIIVVDERFTTAIKIVKYLQSKNVLCIVHWSHGFPQEKKIVGECVSSGKVVDARHTVIIKK